MSNETTITHVIFDLDGTLVDSDTPMAAVFHSYANSIGKALTADQIDKIMSGDRTKLFHNFLEALNLSPDMDRNALSKQLIGQLLSRKWSLMPGADRLVRHLYQHNIPMAIATNSPKIFVDSVFQMFDNNYFGKYFQHYVCASTDPEISHTKPDPEVYIVCKNRFLKAPELADNVLVIEDSLGGIIGAVASGMKTLLVNERKHGDFTQIAPKITHIVNCLDEFKPESVGLPSY